MKAKYHAVIVGAGAAGLAAAHTLSGKGLDLLLLDENPHAGGQFLGKTQPPRNVDLTGQAQVLGIFNDHHLLVHVRGEGREQVRETQCEFLILATGARERFFPFPGWTLPGVISLGGAQLLMKRSGILPGRNLLVGGTSPLQLALASQVITNKGRVTAVLDESDPAQKLGFLPLIPYHWPKLAQAVAVYSQILRARTRIHQGVSISEARGRETLEQVVIATPSGRVKILPAQTLAVGHGFTPNIELPGQAGCDLAFQPDMGGWTVQTDADLETSQANLFAPGEPSGIGGARKSFIEGRLAALAILHRLGKTAPGQTRDDLRQQRNRQLAYARFLNRLCQKPNAAWTAIPDHTLICRCEEITMGEIRRAVRQGFDTPGALKKLTRTGMGNCQGRICGPMILDIIAALTHKDPGTQGSPRFRAPVKNVPVRAFTGEDHDH